jgi:hypothetical protein
MDIANQTFPNFRSDLNSALQALASTNVGASAPATPYDGQLWLDNSATPTLLKRYVLATTTWITIGYMNVGAAALGGMRLYGDVDARTGTSESILNADYGQFLTFSNASAIAATLPAISSTVCPANWYCWVQNKGAGLLTITPTTSTINGASSFAVGTDQGVLIYSDGTNYQIFLGAAKSLGQGIQTFCYGAGAWDPTTTAGASASRTEGATYKINVPYIQFSSSGTTHAQLNILMPKSWDGGTITFRHWGFAASGSGDALLNLKGRAFASGDAYDGGDFGTAQSALTSSCSTTAPKRSAASAAITIANSPAGEKWICLDLYRVAGSGTDTLSGHYNMTHVEINFTINARNDT